MKRSTRTAGLAVLLMVALTAFEAFGEGAVLCTVNVTSTAVDALKPSSDGGTTCSWQRKSVLGLQCPQSEVCFDPTALDPKADGGHASSRTDYLLNDGGISPDGGLDDGGTTPVWTNTGPVATTGSVCVNFITGAGNPDPFIINLGPNEHNISLIASQVADGGSTASCKFIKTLRVQP